MFDCTKIEKKIPLHILTFDGNKWEQLCFIRLVCRTFSCDTDLVQHSRYTGYRNSSKCSQQKMFIC